MKTAPTKCAMLIAFLLLIFSFSLSQEGEGDPSYRDENKDEYGIDLDIWYGQFKKGDKPLPEEKEERTKKNFGKPVSGEDDIGSVTATNWNNTNGDWEGEGDWTSLTANDGIKDSTQDPVEKLEGEPGKRGINEIDLMKIRLNIDKEKAGTGEVELTQKAVPGAPEIQLWEKETKRGKKEFGNKLIKFPVSALPLDLWVEPLSPSGSVSDIVLRLSYKGTWDVVKATSVWFQKTTRPQNQGVVPWEERQIGAPSFPNNPKPGQQLDAIWYPNLVGLIESDISSDGSRYGEGPMRVSDGVWKRGNF